MHIINFCCKTWFVLYYSNKYTFISKVLKRFSDARLTGIGSGTDRLIEEPKSEKSVPVPVPVPTFYIKPVPVLNRNRL